MRFFGNQVCCGSYACLNAIKDERIDPLLFELSTGTPFGVRHCENERFDRLLTTFRDPNRGLDAALGLWGCHVETLRLATAQEVIGGLRAYLPRKWVAVLGPVDMGGLAYQAMAGLLHGMDHYITLESGPHGRLLCTDSEGFDQFPVEYEQVRDWISVKDIPEAAGGFTLRFVRRERAFHLNEILRYTLRCAAENLGQAERQGEGSAAIYRCRSFLEDTGVFRWKLPFLYDLEYFVQRKQLFLLLLETGRSEGSLQGSSLRDLKSILTSQKELAGAVYRALRWKLCLDGGSMQRIGDLEQELAECMAPYV